MMVYVVKGYWYFLEISQGLCWVFGGDVGLMFVLYLMLMICGIYVIFYVYVVDCLVDFQVLFEKCYVDEFFVDVMLVGSYLEICSVCGVNVC